MTTKATNPLLSENINEARKLGALVSQLLEMLNAQHRILQQRGMTLPPGTIEQLEQAKDSLDEIATQLHTQQIELNRLRALADTSALINSSLGLDEVLNEVMDTAIRLTGAERGYIMLRDEASGKMAFRAARNLDQETIQQGSFIVSRSVVNAVAETGEPVVTTNAQNDPRFANQESVVSYALRSILCVPLMVKDVVTGVVYADNRIRFGLFAEAELEILSAFANQAAVAIENARLFEQVRAALAEITENKELLDNVFASILSGVITTDTWGQIIVFNEAAERIFSVPVRHMLNTPVEHSLSPLGENFFSLVRKVQQTDTREDVELQLELPQRGHAVLDMRLSPLKTYEQATRGVTILIDDLTEQRQREATLVEVRRYLPPAMVENIRTIDTIELGGEEREISVVFADVRGFTKFSEQLEPEELMAIINRYLTVSSDAIHLYEGIIDKYMGDAAVGLYNTQLNPQADDHALRAVRAALSMVYDVRALHEVLPPENRLWYGIGIDTGTAVLGNVGSEERKEFTALGKPVNYAKKLQEAAEPGEIIMSEATYRRVYDRIEAEQVERPFRGESTPHAMYRVLGFRRRQRA
ncbi:MAG: GAF domain-containing protein [Anaerolineae bacterium]|nr:GAF domain-containing protein [Anaerolineae bacterium]